MKLFGKNGKSVAPPKAVSDAALKEEGAREAIDHLMSEIDRLPPHILQEALSAGSADLQLAIEDRGWIRFNLLDGSLTQMARNEIIKRARVYYQWDPLAKQAIRLWKDYTFGKGISYKATSEKSQKLIDAMWNDRRNRAVFKAFGQHRSCSNLLVDGEVFFAIFSTDSGMVVRRMEPLEIVQVYKDPDDAERPLYYERDYTPIGTGAEQRTLFYRDWTLMETLEEVPDVYDGKGNLITDDRIQQDVWVYHLALDPMGGRGTSLLMPVIDWTRDHRRFMEARVKIMLAIARFAQKIKGTGSGGSLANLKAQFATGYSLQTGEGMPTDPAKRPIPPGSTWYEGNNVDLEPMSQETNATSARNDGDMLKLMTCAGTGIMLHYFGDPSTGNLATSTAMELPMLKMFEDHQQLWRDTYNDLFQICLDLASVDPAADAERSIDIDFPPIISQDLTQLSTAVMQQDQVVPGFAEDEAVMQQVLMALGVNKVDEVIKRILAAAEQRRADTQANLAAATAAKAAGGIPPGTPGTQGTP